MNIYVGNLAYSTTEDELRSAFEEFGAVSSVNIIQDRDTGRSKGFGFVEMPEKQEAQDAIDKLNNQQLGERTILVNEARPRQDNGGSRGGRGGNRGPRRNY